MTHATALIEYLQALTSKPLNDDLSNRTRRVLLDTLGCGLYGADMRWTQILVDATPHAAGEATVLGYTRKLPPASAALINGTAAHGFELDDFIVGSFTHAGAPVISAALAVAETVDASSERLLGAILAGYEMLGRLGLAMGHQRAEQGLHYTGLLGAVGAAVAAGVVRGFDTNQLRNTIGIAASMGGGIKAFAQGTGGMVKRLHAGRAAEAGVLAADLSDRGFSGPKDGLDGDFGLIFAAGGDDVEPAKLSDGLGHDFMIYRNWTKLYPCCAALHAACQGIEELRAEHGMELDAIARVRLGGSQRTAIQNGSRTIDDTMAAQYSGPFAGALALVGNAMEPAGYAPAAVANDEFRAAMDRIEMVCDPEVDAAYPATLGARVTIELVDGKQYDRLILHPKGTAKAGISTADVESKFRLLAGTRMSGESVEEAIEAVRNIERPDGLSRLSSAIRNVTNAA
jgi:2-methylcitrate dehydratase PrpD